MAQPIPKGVQTGARTKPAFFGYKKKPAASYSRTGGSRTTLGDGALDFSVRNGNWYFCPSMATGMKAVSLETKEKYNVKRERQESLTHSEVK